MTATDPRGEPEVQAVSAALQPYPWRRFRPELLARAVLAANDRRHLHGLLTGLPGTTVGRWEPMELADRDDPRLTRLVGFLAAHRWTGLSLSTVCRQLLALIDDVSG